MHELSVLTTWEEPAGLDLHSQFKAAYKLENENLLELPDYLAHNKSFSDRVPILNYIADNHSDAIVRTKACIILSRSSSNLDNRYIDVPCVDALNILRYLISARWFVIRKDITLRWCVSILNCFAEIGETKEMVVANSMALMNNLLIYGPALPNKTEYAYIVDNTFITSMLRINLSLTPELRIVVLEYLNLLKRESFLPQITDIAAVWELTISSNLTTRQQVRAAITKHLPYTELIIDNIPVWERVSNV